MEGKKKRIKLGTVLAIIAISGSVLASGCGRKSEGKSESIGVTQEAATDTNEDSKEKTEDNLEENPGGTLDLTTEIWFDCLNGDEMPADGSKEIEMPEYPGVVFRAYEDRVEAVSDEETICLYEGKKLWNVFFCDLNEDGRRELCSAISADTEVTDKRIVMFDYANKKSYELENAGVYDYSLRADLPSRNLVLEKYPYAEEILLSIGFLFFGEDRLVMMSEMPQNYPMNGTWYPIVDSFRTIEYEVMRDFETVDAAADVVVIGRFVEDAWTVDESPEDYCVNRFQVSEVLKGELTQDEINIRQNYYFDEQQRFVARADMTPMEKDSEWIYFLCYDEKSSAYYAVGNQAGRFPYADLDVEKLKKGSYSMNELGVIDINNFFVYDAYTDEIYGNYNIYREAIERYGIDL